MSGDEKLIDIFKNNIDVHTAVAAEVFEVPLEKVDKEMRRKAKVINFGILYGMGVNALKQNLGEERHEHRGSGIL
jgi:DNA polymerase-1